MAKDKKKKKEDPKRIYIFDSRDGENAASELYKANRDLEVCIFPNQNNPERFPDRLPGGYNLYLLHVDDVLPEVIQNLRDRTTSIMLGRSGASFNINDIPEDIRTLFDKMYANGSWYADVSDRRNEILRFLD